MSSAWGCLARVCGRENQCFFGLFPVKLGAILVSIGGLSLYGLLLAFNIVSFVVQSHDLALSWTPHLAISLTLIVIGCIVYILVLLGSMQELGEYTNAFYIIFLVMNAIVLSFHLFFGSVALGFALSLIALLNNAPHRSDSSSLVWTSTAVLWQFGRALAYWIITIVQLYSELVVERARTDWKQNEMDKLLEEMAQREINKPKKKPKKTDKVSSVTFDSKA